MYYCPKCDRTIAKDRVEQTDRELREKFGVVKLGELRCPVCNSEYIDLDTVVKGGEKHVGETHRSRTDR